MSDEKRRVGRPRKNYDHEIGKQYGRSEVVSILGGTRFRVGIRVKARCLDCGTEYETRLRRLKAGETLTCGCLKAQNYRDYIANCVARLAPGMVARIWTDRFSGLSRLATAARHNLALGIIDEAQRRYQAQLDSLVHRITGGDDGHRVSVAEAAAEFELPIEAAQYLISAAARRIRHVVRALDAQRAFSKAIARKALKVVVDVEGREPATNWNRSWTPELTRSELRLAKGRLVGSMADLYELCLTLEPSALNNDERADVNAFLQLVRRTLANRRERRDSYLRKMRDNQSPAAKAA